MLQPSESLAFSFTMSMPAGVKDFTTASSTPINPRDPAFLIAAKFVSGPGDDSGFGGTIVPTPGVLALMAVAGVVAARPRRRRD